MKTAVSIPDALFTRADRFAKQRGLSRSQLYTHALRAYLREIDLDERIAQINEICREVDTALPPEIERASLEVLRRSEW